jgi:hypothetical protein
MAGFAHVRRIYMTTGFAVTARTAAIDLGMVNRHNRGPCDTVMTSLTHIR